MTELLARRNGRAWPIELDMTRSAVVICDMWDAHHCVSAASRVTEMAPRVNEVATTLRGRGSLVIHAPSGCTSFYTGTPARLLAREAPRVTPPVSIQWHDLDQSRESPLPSSFAQPGPCSCSSPDACCEAGPPYPWTRQIPSIRIEAGDAVSDEGDEIFNLFESRGIVDVIVMGVHANLCVLGRPFGIRQLVYLGKRPLLCRDLTDSFHRDPMGHCEGTEYVVDHIERFWCPSVTSAQLVGGEPFRLSECG